MKKLLLLVGTLFAVNFVSAMEQGETHFSAKNCGVDISDRQAIIDFYWKRVEILKNEFSRIQHGSLSMDSLRKKQTLSAIMSDAAIIGKGSVHDLNREEIADRLTVLSEEVAAYFDKLYSVQEKFKQEDPKVRLQKIQRKNYENQVYGLQKRFCHFLTTVFDMTVEQKITEVQTILDKAHALSFKSQCETGDVDFARTLSSLIRQSWSKLDQLQSELVSEKTLESRKRPLE